MATKITVFCRLPHGLVLEHPTNPLVPPVKINGINTLLYGDGLIPVGQAAETEIDAEFWDVWSLAYQGFAPLVSGDLYAEKKAENGRAIAREIEKKPTGFEPASQDSGPVTAVKD